MKCATSAVCVLLVWSASAVEVSSQATVTATLRVGVVGSDSSPVPGLAREDFSVQVGGMPVEVRSVRLEAPLPVLVLVDVSVSAGVASEWRAPISREIFGGLAPGTPVRVVSFGRTLRAPGGWESERRAQEAQLSQTLDVPEGDRSGPSPVWDALDESLRTLLPADGRAGIVLVTDGLTTGNRVRLPAVADRAIAMGVPVSVAFVGAIGRMSQQGDVLAVLRPDRPLEQLATATGGAFLNRSTLQRREWTGGAGGDPLRRAATSLMAGYLLEVVVPAQPGFQRVAVSTLDASHIVRVRMGVVAK